MIPLQTQLADAVAAGRLLPESATNIAALLERTDSPVYDAAIAELVDRSEWSELNDRFFRTLAFGTGGLRGKSIGRIVTTAERGAPQPLGRPEHPCVGTNAMNFYNISRATQGLAACMKKFFARERRTGRPSLVVSFDTRHFSREFAELTAQVATGNGCDVFLFEGPRSTPELSFAVRQLGATGGVNITASHNPPEYNGYKVYFEDGAQIVEPHASAIIAEVNAVASETYDPLPEADRGRLTRIGPEIDAKYLDRLESLVLDPALIKRARGLRIVYTPLHGVGGVIIKPLLDRLGFQYSVVASQDTEDGRFPTVQSPNPENAEALTLAMHQADAEGASLVLATDPDDDRMGAAARGPGGALELLTGNQLGSLMAWYRARKHIDLGLLDEAHRSRGVIVKTFVTTDLQKAIAARYGLRCVETLTGFKYIGAKLRKYEEQIPADLRAAYFELPEAETRRLRLEHSSLFVFGGEESYGYSGADFVRDKDGNAAVAMIAEVAAFASDNQKTLPELLDDVFAEFGVHLERNESLVLEGAQGDAAIKKLVASYAASPPGDLAGHRVASIRNFAIEEFRDVEGDLIPKESMILLDAEDGIRVAVRPSGTEPKIKYYLFAARPAPEGAPLSADAVAQAKTEILRVLDDLWKFLERDARARLESAT